MSVCIASHLSGALSASQIIATKTQLYKSHTYTFYFSKNFYDTTAPSGFLPWEIQVAFPRESQL